MSIERNVVAGESSGAECFVCELRIGSGETVIRVEFNVDLLITSTRVSKEMHVVCAEQLHGLLGQRMEEAKGRP